jgi:glycosyltransferase involved in cell wall biosynthesis
LVFCSSTHFPPAEVNVDMSSDRNNRALTFAVEFVRRPRREFRAVEDFRIEAPRQVQAGRESLHLAARKKALDYLHVISSLNPEGGGPAEGVRQLCDRAMRFGNGCEVATLDPPGQPWAESFPCPVHSFGPGRLGKYRYAPRLHTWLRANASRFECVIVNGLWQYHGYAVRDALRECATPYYVFTHGMLDPWFKREYPLKHAKKWLYWPWAEYRVLRDARAVLFTSEEERLLARQSFGLYRATEAVVGYGTPGPSGDRHAQRAAFLARFPEVADKRALLFLGRVHPKKGCDLLIRAFAEHAVRDPALHLVVAGPDPTRWRTALTQMLGNAMLQSRVTWTGMLHGDLKWGAFSVADAFVLPSHQENFGIAVAEALACGVPVLISDKVNIWREIAEDEAGVVAPDTQAGTLRLLQAWLGMATDERDRLRRNAVACYGKRFQIEAATRSLLSVLEQTKVDGHGVTPRGRLDAVHDAPESAQSA